MMAHAEENKQSSLREYTYQDGGALSSSDQTLSRGSRQNKGNQKKSGSHMKKSNARQKFSEFSAANTIEEVPLPHELSGPNQKLI